MRFILRWILFPFLSVDWDHESKYRYPLVRVKAFGLIIDQKEWNGLGNLWMTPQSLEEGVWSKFLRLMHLVK